MCIPANEVTNPVSTVMRKTVDYGLLGGAALADLSNALTFVLAPAILWPLFAAPAIQAKHLPADWTNNRFAPNQMIRPQYIRLPMGFKHSVYLLQQIAQYAVTRTLFADLRFTNIKL